MMFRGPGEFDPSARGLQARAVSLMLPSPSTVAGTLSTVLLEKGMPTPAKKEEWTKKYLSILGSDMAIKCPLLLVGDELYVEDRVLGGLLPFENVRLKARLVLEVVSHRVRDARDMVEGLQLLEENIEGLKNKLSVKSALLSEKVGIGLETRNKEKMARVGLIYSESLVDYTELGYPIEILGDMSGRIPEKFNERPLKVSVRFGGEGRISLMEISEGTKILNKIRGHIWNGKKRFTGRLALYLVSPALFKSGSDLITHIVKWAKSMGLTFIYLYGETEILGGGYSLDVRRRKPLYIALKPGSIIFVKANNYDLVELYWSGVGELATQIGYGTIIPTPLD